MKAKSIRGMSIGFDVLAGGMKIMESGVRMLTDLKLWEISLVTFGMNPVAGVSGVKSREHITSIRDYEFFLREAGFSREQAKILAKSYKDLPGQREAVDEGDDEQAKVVGDILSLLERVKT